MDVDANQVHYLQRLAKQYPYIQAASTAIVDLAAQLSLPKGTEHFVTDIHGGYEAFRHVLRSGSGSIRRKINELFGSALSGGDKQSLTTPIYYPNEKLPLILKTVADEAEWYRTTLSRLVRLCRVVSGKYPRSGVRAFLPDDLASIIEELLGKQESVKDKQEYYQSIVASIVATDSAPTVVIALAELILRLTIARLHFLWIYLGFTGIWDR
jgi:fructose-1,6-bisphosphatase-3